MNYLINYLLHYVEGFYDVLNLCLNARGKKSFGKVKCDSNTQVETIVMITCKP